MLTRNQASAAPHCHNINKADIFCHKTVFTSSNWFILNFYSNVKSYGQIQNFKRPQGLTHKLFLDEKGFLHHLTIRSFQ